MTQPTPTPVMQLERAWHRLMHTMAVKHRDLHAVGRVMDNRITKMMRHR